MWHVLSLAGQVLAMPVMLASQPYLSSKGGAYPAQRRTIEIFPSHLQKCRFLRCLFVFQAKKENIRYTCFSYPALLAS